MGRTYDSVCLTHGCERGNDERNSYGRRRKDGEDKSASVQIEGRCVVWCKPYTYIQLTAETSVAELGTASPPLPPSTASDPIRRFNLAGSILSIVSSFLVE